jgi:hypothetical protein
MQVSMPKPPPLPQTVSLFERLFKIETADELFNVTSMLRI